MDEKKVKISQRNVKTDRKKVKDGQKKSKLAEKIVKTDRQNVKNGQKKGQN